MANDKDIFQERLRRIAEKRGGQATAQTTTQATAPAAPRPAPQPRPAQRKSSLLPLLAGLFLLIGAGSLGAMMFLPELIVGALPVAAATSSDPVEPEMQTASRDGLVSKFLKGLYPGNERGYGDQTPIHFLPDAPEGWVRVTELDVQEPDFLRKLSDNWPKTGYALKDNLGYKRLEYFVRIYAKPDIEQRYQSKRQTKAMYLHPQGQFMTVRLKFLTNRRALGTPENEIEWINALAEVERKALESDEELELNRLAGMAVTNRTKPHGTSLLARRIGQDYDTANFFKIAAPVAHRAVIRITGGAMPRDADRLLAALDRPAIQAQVLK